MRYDKKRHLKLLKCSPKLKNPKKKFSEEEFLKLLESTPDENFFELQKYSVMIISHLQWENQEEYFELIEKLINGPIDFLDLREKRRAINDAEEGLEVDFILLEPNQKSEGFGNLIEELVSLFDKYFLVPSLLESNEFSEEELKKIIQNILIEMKDCYP
jgi:hypothetical protein